MDANNLDLCYIILSNLEFMHFATLNYELSHQNEVHS